MIIVLGMDNSGKSTLVGEISSRFDLRMRHSPGPVDLLAQTNWMLEQIAEGKDEHIVYDRFSCFEEMIYGRVLRGKQLFDLNSPIVDILKGEVPIIIYARPPREAIFNFGEREQMPGVIEKKEKLLAAFDDLIFKLSAGSWAIIPYDYTEPECFDKLMSILENFIYNPDIIKSMRGEL